ncbi:alpha/beta-hydrolase [Pluteus cervinus]|uniref:Alpha/beta-hydrolase n=1 Tax=Pluteus cervinus TaxID=181527 RepID=A0ACD3BHF0_9AGAR|nr:alpha/beta-hydrolase [Pluteus cervinus]
MSKSVHNDPIPLVIVEGFLGGAGACLWGNFEAHLNKERKALGLKVRKCIFASVGPVSSLHDRACELYYALVGGTVDYGAEHSRTHGHSRYGATNLVGLYPEWSCTCPLHFFGHSIGGPTIIKLQDLLKQGYFGPSTRPEMVFSVNSVSAPFRGTQLVYTLGERVDAAPAVRPMSVGSMIGKAVHVISYLSPLLPQSLNLRAEARSLSYHESSLTSLFKQLWSSDWVESKDATPFDVTFEGMEEREANGEGRPCPTTFYRSTTTSITTRTAKDQITHSSSLLNLFAPLYIFSRAIGTFDFSSLSPIPAFVQECPASDSRKRDTEQGLPQGLVSQSEPLLGEEHFSNDGVVPVFSQWHPLPCRSTTCCHVQLPSRNIQPGTWHVYQLDNVSHVSLVPFWFSSSQQRIFWMELGQWLHRVEEFAAIRTLN